MNIKQIIALAFYNTLGLLPFRSEGIAKNDSWSNLIYVDDFRDLSFWFHVKIK